MRKIWMGGESITCKGKDKSTTLIIENSRKQTTLETGAQM
jgi:hypothetical protein